MIWQEWHEYTWWLNFHQICQSTLYRVYRLYAICSRTAYASSGITSVKINFPSLCLQNLISWTVLNQLCAACGCSGFGLVVASLKLSHQILAPGVCFVVKSTGLKNWASCLASWRQGHKHQFCSEHQLLGQSEPQPRKRNTECLEWSGVTYAIALIFDYVYFLCILFVQLLCQALSIERVAAYTEWVLPFQLYEPLWRRLIIPFYEG